MKTLYIDIEANREDCGKCGFRLGAKGFRYCGLFNEGLDEIANKTIRDKACESAEAKATLRMSP
jgi:hypothetical protein